MARSIGASLVAKVATTDGPARYRSAVAGPFELN